MWNSLLFLLNLISYSNGNPLMQIDENEQVDLFFIQPF